MAPDVEPSSAPPVREEPPVVADGWVEDQRPPQPPIAFGEAMSLGPPMR